MDLLVSKYTLHTGASRICGCYLLKHSDIVCVPQAKCDALDNVTDAADTFGQARLVELSEKMKVGLFPKVLLRIYIMSHCIACANHLYSSLPCSDLFEFCDPLYVLSWTRWRKKRRRGYCLKRKLLKSRNNILKRMCVLKLENSNVANR